MTIFLNDLDGTDGFSLTTQELGDRSGFDVSSAGDVNGDGLADFLVGAFAAKADFASNPSGGRQLGAAYVVYGRAQNDRSEVDLQSLDGSDGCKIDSGLDQDSLGLSVSGAGDFNGDGLDDIVIRSLGSRAYVVFGGANEGAASFSTSALNGANGFNYDLETAGNEILHKARSAGDINNDGFDDVFSTGAGDDLVDGGAGDDRGALGDGDDTAHGGAGNDLLKGDSGNDALYGEAGSDRLLLGAGDDKAFGGDGDDLIYVRPDELNRRDVIDGGDGLRDTLVSIGADFLNLRDHGLNLDVEQVRLASGQAVAVRSKDLTLIGANGDETFRLQADDLITTNLPGGGTSTQAVTGSYKVFAGDGDDRILASNREDILFGQDGDDVILGGDRNDMITGGAGLDRIRGDEGADTFIFERGFEIDIIYDFENNTDKLDVSNFSFRTFATDIAARIDVVNSKTVVDLGPGDRIILIRIAPSELDASDFIV
jgi:Ca2+-binding RTX toxin-like protein